jgi:hypothetical protein
MKFFKTKYAGNENFIKRNTLGMKILQNEITETHNTSFSSNFVGKLEFYLVFPFS